MGTLMTPAAAPRSMVTLVPPPSDGGDIGCGPIGVTCNGTTFSGCMLEVLVRCGRTCADSASDFTRPVHIVQALDPCVS